MKNIFPVKTAVRLFVFGLLTGFSSCGNGVGEADAYGNFETTEVIVSSEGNGKILSLALEEGDLLKKDHPIGFIDTIQLSLKLAQLQVAMESIDARSNGVLSQLPVLKEQEENLIRERDRVVRLLKDSAATQKQLDDLNGQLKVIEKQRRSIEIQNQPVIIEKKNVEVQQEELTDQLNKCRIASPINGTVLIKYAEAGEVTAFGKPLFKVADMENMILRVFVSENQLSQIKTGQKVRVRIDTDSGESDLDGIVSWISPAAEFTPKIIQTKEERVNLVYAVKISVKNDGRLKIGMPGEMHLK